VFRKSAWTFIVALFVPLASVTAAATSNQFYNTIERAELREAIQLAGQLFHVQGLELDSEHIWVTSVDDAEHKGYLHQFDRATGRLLRQIELTDGQRYHPGGISIADGSIWVPVAEYRPNSTAVLLQIDISTLRVRRRIRVADHLGCAAASEHTLVAGNWDSKLLYIFDLTGKRPVRIVPNPTATSYQDMKIVDGQLVASGTKTLWSGTIDWIDLRNLTVTRSLHAGAMTSDQFLGGLLPYTREGMAIEGSDLYFMPEDGPSRLIHFRLL
jgi:hypothetical protein